MPFDDGYLKDAFAPLKQRLDAIEEIRADLTKERIQVPGVVVIGNQSSGKSSLLEAVCGVNFPRGENTCTRCPCIVRLEPQASSKPYALIGRDPEFEDAQRIENFDEIGSQIEYFTNSHVGVGTTISTEPIHLKVVRPEGPTLSLIDLPGITHVSDKQKDIHDIVTKMIRGYVSNQEMVILVVIPAHDDFGNAEALKIAQEVDADGKRTLGVATKTDLIPKDSDIVSKLTCARTSDIRLKLGWIAVRCRTPSEVKANKPADEIETLEAELFEQHELLSSLDRKHWGMKTLVNRIVEIQSLTVQKFIPKAKIQIIQRIREVEAELESMPAPCKTDDEKKARFTQKSFELQESLKELIEARGSHTETDLHISARTHEKFRAFKKAIDEGMPNFISQEYAATVKGVLNECAGAGLSNFISAPAFNQLILGVLFPLLSNAATSLIEDTAKYIERTLTKLSQACFSEFPRLLEDIQEDTEAWVSEHMQSVKARVNDLIDAEKIVFTLDTYYDELIQKVKSAVAENQRENTIAAYVHNAKGLTEEKMDFLKKVVECPELDIDFLKRGLDVENTAVWNSELSLFVYSKVVRRRLCDVVPMQVKLHLVLKACDKGGFAKYLLQRFTKERVSNLMEIDPVTEGRREEKEASLKRLKHSLDVLRKIESE